MAIDDNSASFTVRIEGEVSFETWSGTFRAKTRLAHKDFLLKDRFRRELLGSTGGASTDRALTTAEIISDLHIRIVDSPKWWVESEGGLNLVDDRVLVKIHELAVQVEKDALEEKKKKAEEAKKEMRKDLDEKTPDKLA